MRRLFTSKTRSSGESCTLGALRGFTCDNCIAVAECEAESEGALMVRAGAYPREKSHPATLVKPRDTSSKLALLGRCLGVHGRTGTRPETGRFVHTRAATP